MMSSKQAISKCGSGKYGMIKSSMRKGMPMPIDCSEQDAILYFDHTILIQAVLVKRVSGEAAEEEKKEIFD